MSAMPPVERFISSTGARIYRIPVEAFPDFIAYCYLILEAGPPTLVDTGSGYGESNQHLQQGFEAVRTQFNESVQLADIQRVIITHGHIDHHGGLGFVMEHAPNAQIGIHALDRRIISAYRERVIVATKDMRVYLERAGVSERLREKLLEMYGFAKRHMQSFPVSFLLDEYKEIDGMSFIHTPGHCSGQVCIRLGDILLSADHILAQTTPNQAPESITHYTGLGHYLESLYKVARVEGIRLALPGHEEPIENLYDRIIAIRASHQRKLDRVLNIIREAEAPCTISEISHLLYDERTGYDVLLALGEAGAHVEYLYEHGQLAIANLDEVEQAENPALRYISV